MRYNDMDSGFVRLATESKSPLFIIAWDRKSTYRARKLNKERMENQTSPKKEWPPRPDIITTCKNKQDGPRDAAPSRT